MCSIPGLPTPGSEVTVGIRRVNPNPKCGLVELWVNIDDGSKHAYEQMKEQIQLPKRKFCGSEGKTGDLCLVCIGNMWHRARIMSSQSETCKVFLIDQGQSYVSTWDALAWGQSDSFFLPPEIESCILANILSVKENWSKKATKFLTSLAGKTLNGVVKHVLMPDRTILLDIPLVSKQMCTLGAIRKVPADDFKGVVLECLTSPKEDAPVTACNVTLDRRAKVQLDDRYFYPELLCGMYETVNVTEVTDPGNIFCNLQIYSKSLKTLSEEIQQFYKESSESKGERPQTYGEPCAARGSNGMWYRSLLKQNIGPSDELVEVAYVDVGKTELVSAGCIRHMARKFLRMPVVTYRFSLYGVVDDCTGWTANQNEYLKSLLLDKTFVAKIEKHFQETYSVMLYAGNAQCMNTCFTEKAKVVPPALAEGQQKDVQIEPPSEEQDVHFKNLVSSTVKNLQEKALSRTENGLYMGNADTVPSSDPSDFNTTDDQHLSQSFHHEHVLSVGRTLDVTVSCVEGPQKFWCQKTKSGESLRRLMKGVQNHYASVHPLPIVKSLCVTRNPDDGMWYRAKIITNRHSPEVDLQFLDYGGTRRVPLGDVFPIDPAFLELEAQAFQCRLVNPKVNSSWTASASAEFQKFLAAGDSQHAGFKCIVKDRTCDEEGQPVNVVDLETPSQSAWNVLSLVPMDTYNYSTYDMELGTKEKVWVTFSETVHSFFCQLNRNSHLFNKVMEDVQQLVSKSQCSGDLVRSDALCLVRYSDNEWYRGKVIQTSPEPKVLFVDYGDTLTVNSSHVRPWPASASAAKSVPVLAVALGLFGVPADVPQEVNQWFANHAVGTTVTVSVVDRGDSGKLMVEVFEGLLNVNVIVREKVAHVKRAKTSQGIRADQVCSKQVTTPDEDFLTEELNRISNLGEQNKDQNGKGACAVDEPLLERPQYTTLVAIAECEHEKMLNEESTQCLNVTPKVLVKTPKDINSNDAEMLQPEKSYAYHMPIISHHKSEEMYASCIVGPSYFWCQFAHTENLNAVSSLAQSIGEALQDSEVPKSLIPGSPCLALFSTDSKWYRAEVLRRNDSTVCILFVDYGNESEVDIKDVRYLPCSLMEYVPQAFLCSLDGFDESKGSWDDEVYDDFYNLLVDKPLAVTVVSAKNNSEIVLQEHSVKIKCEGTDVNEVMQKYWKPIYTQTEDIQAAYPPQPSPPNTESNMTLLEENANVSMYKKPNISPNKSEMVYASCVVDPNFFWCQFADTDALERLSILAEEAGRAEPHLNSLETLIPASPCLALYSVDRQWYRAQVISREDRRIHVVFIDYGNDSVVDVRDVRQLPLNLRELAPEAFLCSLRGFGAPKWDDGACEEFFSLIIDKPLRVSVFHVENHLEVALPQHAVEIVCEGIHVNQMMAKYGKEKDA
ncbi:tudor domain-containing 6 [Phycodurus eques]|uniref:tudor domain-containing 6 n=1 Tax=Phycodurus eques TaxID=693459 RepID=UPI002ACDC4B1|nr:tudor domain-containing 6 [Phycodurus eques]